MCTKYIINILKKSQQNPPHYQDYSTASLVEAQLKLQMINEPPRDRRKHRYRMHRPWFAHHPLIWCILQVLRILRILEIEVTFEWPHLTWQQRTTPPKPSLNRKPICRIGDPRTKTDRSGTRGGHRPGSMKNWKSRTGTDRDKKLKNFDWIWTGRSGKRRLRHYYKYL